MTILLHEIVHGLSDQLGDGFEEERVVRWSNALADTLIRNGLVDLPKEATGGKNGKSSKGKR
jgi:hypothetical protein